MSQTFDRSSHWLISHHGDSILRLAGLGGFRSWRPLATNVVQPRRLPDGLLEVFHDGESDADLYLVEISTYPERRLENQMLDDAMLVYLDKKVLPELVSVVLCPRGNLRITGRKELVSRRTLSRLELDWRVVELWNVPAASLLSSPDVGLLPWVPLARIDGPPDATLQHCRERMDHEAAPHELANMLAVTQVLTKLRYNEHRYLEIFGGRRAMIESPLLQELVSERTQEHILLILATRFGEVPQDLPALLQPIHDDEQLKELLRWAVRCPDLDSFRTRLSPSP